MPTFGELRVSQVVELMEQNYDLFSSVVNLCLSESIVEIDRSSKEVVDNVVELARYKYVCIQQDAASAALISLNEERVKSQGGI